MSNSDFKNNDQEQPNKELSQLEERQKSLDYLYNRLDDKFLTPGKIKKFQSDIVEIEKLHVDLNNISKDDLPTLDEHIRRSFTTLGKMIKRVSTIENSLTTDQSDEYKPILDSLKNSIKEKMREIDNPTIGDLLSNDQDTAAG